MKWGITGFQTTPRKSLKQTDVGWLTWVNFTKMYEMFNLYNDLERTGIPWSSATLNNSPKITQLESGEGGIQTLSSPRVYAVNDSTAPLLRSIFMWYEDWDEVQYNTSPDCLPTERVNVVTKDTEQSRPLSSLPFPFPHSSLELLLNS